MALKQPIRHLIFDLDDTLFDTLGQLVEPATREACKAMVEKGLNADFERCLRQRQKIFAEVPRQNIYREITRHFGVKPGCRAEDVEKAGIDAFYNREIREDLQAFADTGATLAALHSRYSLFLVTMGAPRTQKRKVDLLKIAPYFHEIHYVDNLKEAGKSGAFKKILKSTGTAAPSEFVSIGNRIDSEIRDAKELGMQAILMVHGEYAHLTPESPAEEPDARIHRLSELPGLLAGGATGEKR